jgi:hypothetical protein
MGSSSSGSAANSAGTHVAGSGPVTMALSQFQTEMSRINLLRVRGEFSAAKASCLVLLKSFPQSVEAHLMMGDIHSELTEFPQAIEWYSLANDLDKSSSAAQNKLKRAQSALDRMQNPKDSKLISSSVALAVVAGIAAIAIGAIAFLAGSTSSGNRTDTIVQRVVAPRNEGESKSPTAVTTPPPAVRIESSAAANFDAPEANRGLDKPENNMDAGPLVATGDRILLEQIGSRTELAKHIVNIEENPRDNSLTLTYSVSKSEHGRYIGACLAVTAMEYQLKVRYVTIRGIRDGMLMYMADVTREKVATFEISMKKSVLGMEDHSWIDQVLTNEYKRGSEFANGSSSSDSL